MAKTKKPAARPAKLTPEQAATIERVWLATANAAAAAREAGCSERSARRVIIGRGLPDSAGLYAQALAREERFHLDVVRTARRKVKAQLAEATTTSAIFDLTRAANDSLRSVTATRIAHLKATGLAAPEKHDVTIRGMSDAALDDELRRLAAGCTPKGAAGAGTSSSAGEGSPGSGARADAGGDEAAER